MKGVNMCEKKSKAIPGKWLYKLKDVARSKNVSNHWLAFKTGLTYDRIVAIRGINGKATPEEIELIANVLGVTADALGGEDVRRPRVKNEGLSRPAYRLTKLGAVLKSKGIKRKDFAEELKIGFYTLVAICQGQNKLTWQEVQQIAQLLSVDPEELGYYETASRSDLKNWRKARIGGK